MYPWQVVVVDVLDLAPAEELAADDARVALGGLVHAHGVVQRVVRQRELAALVLGLGHHKTINKRSGDEGEGMLIDR